MTRFCTRSLGAVLGLAACVAVGATASAQTSEPARDLVVPFTAGSITDGLRILADMARMADM